MSASAQAIYDSVSLGARIAYSDGKPRPPARFKRKVREWENSNGEGVLTQRRPGYRPGDPAMFTLRLTGFGSRESMILIANMVLRVTDARTFTVVQDPEPGSILCITRVGGVDELKHVTSSQAEAAQFMEGHRSSDPRLETVSAQLAAA